MAAETVRWSLTNAATHVVCTERTSPSHIELHVKYANLPIASKRCSDAADAARWADQLRRAWEASGWKSA